MRPLINTVLVTAAVAAICLAGASPALAAGPWKGQVVDEETGQPLEGVVVLFYWLKDSGTLATSHGGTEFYDAEEVVTGPDGRFVIPSRRIFTLLPWKHFIRQIVIFKPGYGQWAFQGLRDPQNLPYSQYEARRDEAEKQLEHDGVVVTLPLLNTKEQRLDFLRQVSWALVPSNLTQRMRAAKDAERIYLGLGD